MVALAHVYFEDEPGRRSAAKMLSGDEAQRIPANIAKLPGVAARAAADKRGDCTRARLKNKPTSPARPRADQSWAGDK